MRFHVLTRRFRGACCFHKQGSFRIFEALRIKKGKRLIAVMIEAPSTSETSVNFYQTTRHNNPNDSYLLGL
jgi:hypothetical protein